MRIGYGSTQGCQSCNQQAQRAGKPDSDRSRAVDAQRPRNDGTRNARNATRTASVEGLASSKAELSLTTADGDKVTLSFATQQQESYSDYSSLGVQRRTASQGYQAQVEIKVEGDLSKEELADINKLAKLVTQAAGEAASGDVDKAAARTAQAGKLDTIQNFAFSLNQSVQRRFAYEATLDQLR